MRTVAQRVAIDIGESNQEACVNSRVIYVVRNRRYGD